MQRRLAFSYSGENTISRERLNEARMVTADALPWPTRLEFSANELAATRSVYESVGLRLPWPVEEFGEIIVRTASLMERQRPYCLALEVARGQVNKIRNQVSDWELAGMRMAQPATELLRQAGRELGQAIRAERIADAERYAAGALRSALWAGEMATQDHSRQAIAARRKKGAMPRTGCAWDDRLPLVHDLNEVRRLFDHLSIPLDWRGMEPESGARDWAALDRRVQWCLDHGFTCTVGPLVDFRPGALPEFISNQADVDVLCALLQDMVESAVGQFQDRVRSWEIAARPNSTTSLRLTEEQMLWVVGRVIESVVGIDPQSRVSIAIDRPWGDYLAEGRRSYAPTTFVDRLLRSDLPLAAVSLEIAMGFPKHSSFCRSLLDFSQLLDLYSQLAVPLHVRLLFPSAPVEGGQVAGVWHDAPSEEVQADWLEGHLSVALGKPAVELVSWGAFQDDAAGDVFPFAGLLDANGGWKKAAKRLRAVRRSAYR